MSADNYTAVTRNRAAGGTGIQATEKAVANGLRLVQSRFVEWNLGLSSWIIQDGNYDDVRRGDRLEAAVEFGFEESVSLTEVNEPSARCHRDNVYDVVGRVATVEADVWVVDIGISIFNEHAPPGGLAVGDCIAGKVWVGVDPFFYFERLAKRASMPPLIYTWRVVEIYRQTAPFVPAGPRLLVRDASKLGWESIEHTDAAGDDGGRAEYLLRCELLPGEPRRARTK